LRKIRYLFYSRIYWDKFINTKKVLQCYCCQAFGHTSANCYKNPRCVKCAQSHLTSDCVKSPDIPVKCCNCSGDHPASYSQCPAYIRFLKKRLQVTSRDNYALQAENSANKNLQLNNVNHVKRTFKSHEGSSDLRQNPLIYSRNNNIHDKRQTQQTKTYAAMIHNNNSNIPISEDISNFKGLISEINKLKQLVNVSHMLTIIRNLNNRLANCKDGLEKLQAFIEASELLDFNG